jgi:hypothetical protein
MGYRSQFGPNIYFIGRKYKKEEEELVKMVVLWLVYNSCIQEAEAGNHKSEASLCPVGRSCLKDRSKEETRNKVKKKKLELG